MFPLLLIHTFGPTLGNISRFFYAASIRKAKLFKRLRKTFKTSKRKKGRVRETVGFLILSNIYYTISDVKYTISPLTFPIPPQRWGFLPVTIQRFLRTDNETAKSSKNAAIIAPNKPCYLRYGVEFSENQSFMACIAEIYNYKQFPGINQLPPSMEEMRTILAQSVTLDLLAQYHDGNLISIFAPSSNILDDEIVPLETYKTSLILGQLHETQQRRLVTAYEKFVSYLTDPLSTIDHTFLWDVVCDNNPKLNRGGINLVVLEILDQDPTDNVALICPTHSKFPTMDPQKETIFLLKRGPFYEPIYYYIERKNTLHITKGFMMNQFEHMTEVLTMIQKMTKTYCAAQPSRKNVYESSHNVLVQEVLTRLQQHDIGVLHQVVNYREQVIGISVEPGVVVPCLPSGIQNDVDLPIRYMDDTSLWTDYTTTLKTLTHIHQVTHLPCRPQVNMEDDQVIVGILTETNQFVHVIPFTDETISNRLPTIGQSDYIMADKTITTAKKGDEERIVTMKTIQLESQFYAAFRMSSRKCLHLPQNRSMKDEIVLLLDNKEISYKTKMTKILSLLSALVHDQHVQFQDMDLSVVLALGNVVGCVSHSKDNADSMVLLVPKTNLIHGRDNQQYYFARLADELIRYSRIRLFMMDSQLYYNGANVQYQVNKEELLILLSLVDKDGTYFDDIVPFRTHPNVRNLTYDTAQPRTSHVTYHNTIALEEQNQLLDQQPDNGGFGETRSGVAKPKSSIDIARRAISTDDDPIPTDLMDSTYSTESSESGRGSAVIDIGEAEAEAETEIETKNGKNGPIIGQAKAIQGNRSTSFWVFPMDAMEITFQENTNKNVKAMQWVLEKQGLTSILGKVLLDSRVCANSLTSCSERGMPPSGSGAPGHPKPELRLTFTSQFIGETIANSRYVNLLPEKLIHLWNKQGKQLLMRKVVTLNLPVMLFAGTNLKNMVSEKWLFLSSTLEDIHSTMYFVRSDTVRESNHPAKYSVISPQVQVEQLQNAKKDCEGKIEIQNAIRANKLITLETFLETLPNPTIHVIRRKK